MDQRPNIVSIDKHRTYFALLGLRHKLWNNVSTLISEHLYAIVYALGFTGWVSSGVTPTLTDPAYIPLPFYANCYAHVHSIPDTL